MGFSSALQGKTAHDALLVRQDAELRLLEVMKRCLLQKVKCDKEYAIALTAAAQHGLKIDRADDLQGEWRYTKNRHCDTHHHGMTWWQYTHLLICVCVSLSSNCRKPSDESMANRNGRMGTIGQTI